MEPNGLNPPPPEEPEFEAWLRSHASLPALPDEGFAQRVLTSLPASPRRAPRPPRIAAVLVGAAAGVGFAAYQYFTAAPVDPVPAAIGPQVAEALAQLADPRLHAALGVTAITLALVFRRTLRRRVRL